MVDTRCPFNKWSGIVTEITLPCNIAINLLYQRHYNTETKASCISHLQPFIRAVDKSVLDKAGMEKLGKNLSQPVRLRTRPS